MRVLIERARPSSPRRSGWPIEAGSEAMCDAPTSDLACAEADVAFHASIPRACHNPVFAGLISLISEALENSFRLTTSVSQSYVTTLAAHGDVLETIRLRQPEIASERMRALIEMASSDLLRHTVELQERARRS